MKKLDNDCVAEVDAVDERLIEIINKIKDGKDTKEELKNTTEELENIIRSL